MTTERPHSFVFGQGISHEILAPSFAYPRESVRLRNNSVAQYWLPPEATPKTLDLVNSLAGFWSIGSAIACLHMHVLLHNTQIRMNQL